MRGNSKKVLPSTPKRPSGGGKASASAKPSGIVCLGASAGGLASLKTIISALPFDFPWPILVMQHFPADVRSHLSEILARKSVLAVREAIEGQSLAPGTVLTSPSGAEMGVALDRSVTFRPRKRGPPDSIDHLFNTASLAAGQSMVAVVLSGLGSDGAAGTGVVKKNGGTVIVESPETAEWAGMPSAAIRAGPVDDVLPSHGIAPRLMSLMDLDRRGTQTTLKRRRG